LNTLQTILENPPDELQLLLVKQNLGILLINKLEVESRKLLNHNVRTVFFNKFETMKLTLEDFKDVQWPGPDKVTFTLEQELFKPRNNFTENNVEFFEPKKPYPPNVRRYSLSDDELVSKVSGIPLTEKQELDLKRYPPLDEDLNHMVEFVNLQGAIDYFSTLNVSTLGGGKTRKSRKTKKLSRYKKRKHYSKLSRIYIKPSKVSNFPPRV
jgi:hypothetical protein